ncbi:dimethylarginine dimethylaminohydrolase family protein [Atlantibacter subterraneus]|uniref:dimethylarginine dimethylaminohydrolase family protein n=1 Tax=Atlantibacter subterraneus TaxID=255519 RepID=UPI00289B9A47|nr:arginine deiminase family protein [Atlantibacter subterranea]
MNKHYVKDATSRLKKVLLCPPDYFSFQPINVITEDWIEKGESADISAFKREHAELVQAYRENGVEVVFMDPDPELPYEVYARDFGACVKEGFIMGAFREPCRKGETQQYEAKMKALGIPCVARCTAGAFEGGDFWMIDEHTIAHGIVARTDLDGFKNVERQMWELGYTMVPIFCQRENLHLDMCFNIVAEKVAVICRAALPWQFINLLERRGFTLIDIPQEGVFRHHCNLQALGDGRVLTFENNKAVNQQMRCLGLSTIEPGLEQILKGGGGPHCMTFPLERE